MSKRCENCHCPLLSRPVDVMEAEHKKHFGYIPKQKASVCTKCYQLARNNNHMGLYLRGATGRRLNP